MFDSDRLWDYVIAVIFAAFGGMAKLLSAKTKRRIGWGIIFAELFVSGFVGLMAMQLCIALGIESAWVGVVCGAMGFAGVRALDGVVGLVAKKTGIDLAGGKAEDKTGSKK